MAVKKVDIMWDDDVPQRLRSANNTELSIEAPDSSSFLFATQDGKIEPVACLKSDTLQVAIGTFDDETEVIVTIAQRFGDGGLFTAMSLEDLVNFRESLEKTEDEAKKLQQEARRE